MEVIRAWPRRHESIVLDLPEGTQVAQAVALCGWTGEECGYAVHGVAVTPETPLQDGDRLELLRPLQMDPKEARRKRARKTV